MCKYHLSKYTTYLLILNFDIIKKTVIEVNAMQAIVKCTDDSYYFSMVFGCICMCEHKLATDSWYDYAYVVLDESKTNLILYNEFFPENKFLEPMLLFIDVDQSNWEVNELGEGGIRGLITPEILTQIKENCVPNLIVQKCIQLDQNLKETSYRKIKTPQDIENFLSLSRRLHDALIENISLKSNRLLVRFDGVWGCKLLLCFTGNPEINFVQDTSYDYHWQECAVLLHENRYYLINDSLTDYSQLANRHQWFAGDSLGMWVIPNKMPQKAPKKMLPFQQSKKLRLAQVQFDNSYKLYTYLCPDETFECGDFVLVPVGKQHDLKIAQIYDTYEAYPESVALPFPIEKLKTIAKHYSGYDEERVIERVITLLDKKVLDFSKVDANFEQGIFDLLETPMGYFWIELAGEPIPIKIVQQTLGHEKNSIDCLLRLKPVGVTPDKVKSLKLLASFDLADWRCVDIVSDEFIEGGLWEKNGLTFGVSANISKIYEDEVIMPDKTTLPYYAYWHPVIFEHNPDFYGFDIVWEKSGLVDD